MYSVKPIGVIHSSIKTLKDSPLQESENAPEATLEIFPEFMEAALDLIAGEKYVLLTWLDKADRSIQSTLPRNNPHARLTGVFSTRSPDRPNPIGLHRVIIRKVEGRLIRLSALEVLDGTPVIDLKIAL